VTVVRPKVQKGVKKTIKARTLKKSLLQIEDAVHTIRVEVDKLKDGESIKYQAKKIPAMSPPPPPPLVESSGPTTGTPPVFVPTGQCHRLLMMLTAKDVCFALQIVERMIKDCRTVMAGMDKDHRIG
jgi:hypothetical protein